MTCVMQFKKTGGLDMGVNLSCRNVCMAEEHLHGSQVRSALKEMGRK